MEEDHSVLPVISVRRILAGIRFRAWCALPDLGSLLLRGLSVAPPHPRSDFNCVSVAQLRLISRISGLRGSHCLPNSGGDEPERTMILIPSCQRSRSRR